MRNRSGGVVGRGVAPPGVSACRPVVAALPPQRADKQVLRGPAAPAPPLAQVPPERLQHMQYISYLFTRGEAYLPQRCGRIRLLCAYKNVDMDASATQLPIRIIPRW